MTREQGRFYCTPAKMEERPFAKDDSIGSDYHPPIKQAIAV